MKTWTPPCGRDGHQRAQVVAVLEHREDAAQLLALANSGRLHDVEEPFAEDVLHGRGIEVVHQPRDALARPAQRISGGTS